MMVGSIPRQENSGALSVRMAGKRRGDRVADFKAGLKAKKGGGDKNPGYLTETSEAS